MTQRELSSYIIKGGEQGRARLGAIARVMAGTTAALLDRFEPLRDRTVIDAGCGGGDITFELARLVGPGGRVVGFDLDETKLALARDEAATKGMANIEFRRVNVLDVWPMPVNEVHLVYIRFVLTHLTEPEKALERALAVLAPGGVVVIEDIDYGGDFCDPPSAAYERYSNLYVEAARRRGADPFIGRRLMRLLESVGFTEVDSSLIQPFGRRGDVKQIPFLTFAAIADSLIQLGLATAEEIADLTSELQAFTERSDTVVSLPRIFQVWGRSSRG